MLAFSSFCISFLLFLTIMTTNIQIIVAQYTVNDKTVGVQLFQWKFTDIAKECTEFLGPNGYSYVQTSPIQECITSNNDGKVYPWYVAYQPLGYNIGNRLGTEQEFEDMVKSCTLAGVDVVVDVVLNHFSAHALSSTIETNGGYAAGFGVTSDVWTATNYGQNFPDALYNSTHFHDSVCINDIGSASNPWTNDFSVWNCRLSSLVDVATENSFVRSQIAKFLNKLLSYGVVGFRVDATKSIPEGDLKFIFDSLDKNYLGNHAFISNEIMYAFDSDHTYKNYADTGRIINFNYAQQVGQIFRGAGSTTTDKIASVLNNFENNQYLVSDAHSTTIIENHDKERDSDGNSNYALSRLNSGWWYKQAQAFSILYPWGLPIVHSGYAFTYDGDSGKPVTAPYSTGGYISPVGEIKDNICPSAWWCQHRWSDIFPLVSVRNYLSYGSTKPTIKTTASGSNQIYWSVINKGFVLINSAQGTQTNQNLNVQLNTGLPPGSYCNTVYAFASDGRCVLHPGLTLVNGEVSTYVVDVLGNTQVKMASSDKSRVIALFTNNTHGIVSQPLLTQVTWSITHTAAYGDNVYIVGNFQGWDTCNAIKCTFSTGNIWTCSYPLQRSQTSVFQYKPITFGSSCSSAVYYSGSNLALNTGAAETQSVAFSY